MVNINKNLGGVRNSAIASQHCPSGHITADKRLRCVSPKLPSALRLNVEIHSTPLEKESYLKERR